jgi:hypothetical protein
MSAETGARGAHVGDGERAGAVAAPDGGRAVDPARALLVGEAAEQAVPEDRLAEGAAPYDVWTAPAEDAGPPADRTYYERPVLKRPVWIWAVPAYFVAGGAAGAAAVVGGVAQVAGRGHLDGLVRWSRIVSAAGSVAGAGFLVRDLGRSSRFANMLRVFRPTSPMSVGSWVLAAFTPAAVGSAVLAGAGGVIGSIGDVGGLVAAALGAPLAGYTGVLLGNTAIPAWNTPRRWLPPLFVASGLAGAAAALQTVPLSDRERRVTRVLTVAAGLAQLASHAGMDRSADRLPRVGTPLHEGRPGALLRMARAASVVAVAASLLGGRFRAATPVAAAAGGVAAVASKFGVFEAGKASAEDPRATFQSQRARVAAR